MNWLLDDPDTGEIWLCCDDDDDDDGSKLLSDAVANEFVVGRLKSIELNDIAFGVDRTNGNNGFMSKTDWKFISNEILKKEKEEEKTKILFN